MNRIERLTRELCPQGVPHMQLGKIGEFIRGAGIQKKDLLDEGTPAFHYGEVHTAYGISTESTVSFINPEKLGTLRYAQPGDLIIATTSEDDEAVGKATAWLGNQPAAVSSDAFIFHHGLNPNFVSHFFNSTSFSQQKRRFITGAKVRRLSGDSLSKIIMPIPPAEIQKEIADILDKFQILETELEAKLEAELEIRKVQYSFYRDALLSFSEIERERERERES